MREQMSDRSRHRQIVRATVRPFRRRIVELATASFFGGLLEALFLIVVTRAALAIANGKTRAGVLAGHDLSIAWALTLAGGILVARLGFAGLAARQSADLQSKVLVDARHRLASAYLHTSWAVQQAERSGQLQELMSSYAGASSGLVSSYAGAVSTALSLIALVSASLIVSPLASLVVLGALAVLGNGIAPLRRSIKRHARAASGAGAEFYTSVTELGSLGMEMQVFGTVDAFGEHIDRLLLKDAAARRRHALLQGSIAPIYSTLAYIALLSGLALAALAGPADLSEVGAVMLVMLRSLGYGQSLQNSAVGVVSAVPFVETYNEAVERFEAAATSSGETVITSAGTITVEDLRFEYEDENEVLHGLSFTVPRGDVVGIVGPSGGGKSTLVQLLLGLRQPTSGSIRVDGVDLHDIERSAWTDRVAFVPQEANLFSGTIADNVRFFRPSVERRDVEDAVRWAHLDVDIEQMDGGIETQVGERGSRLSGGQRQRLSIARALVGRPDLLILDEPTSALDAHSESMIRGSIAELRGSTTVVIIAHRLSTLDICDRIMVIEDGAISAFDHPLQLAERDDFYRHALELSGLV